MNTLTKDYMNVHRKQIVIDGTCPLGQREEHIFRWHEGGVTVMAPTVATNENMQETINNLATWFRRINSNRSKLINVQSVEDIYEAKRTNKLGILFHFQNSLPLENNIDLLTVYHKLGVRVIQLCYNQKNLIGDGCDERTDSGLSEFGIKVIKEMNRLGIVVDLSHTGYQTTMEAIEVSEKPVIVSHANVYNLCPVARNLKDDQIVAIAQKGGLVGINGYPAFVSKKKQPTIDDYIDHIDYIVDLVGVEHVAVSLDFYEGMSSVADDYEAKKIYNEQITDGRWKNETYPEPPWHYPQGLSLPEEFPNLTKRLIERGYSESDLGLIMGENFIRVYKEVW